LSPSLSNIFFSLVPIASDIFESMMFPFAI